jgi:hypothetical protein
VELVETVLSPAQSRAGAVWVTWRDLAAQQVRRGEQVRVLNPGDDVLLQAPGGTVHRGYVLRNVGAGVDTASVVVFGAAVSRRAPVGERRPAAVQDVEVRVVPAQRGPAMPERRRVNLYL